MSLKKITDNIDVSPDGCWNWKKSTNSSGYGQLTVDKKYWTAHRYALSLFQEVNKSDVVRHKCHNTKCCNPLHLVTGTHRDNYIDSNDSHTQAAIRSRKKWSIAGVCYGTCREAAKLTGLSISSVIKFTKDGVFDIDDYRFNCKKAGHSPKI